MPVATDRANKAEVRLSRIGRLAQRSATAAKLILTGAYPQFELATEMQGVGLRRIQRMRSATAAATGRGGAGRYATTTIALALGRRADPEVRGGLAAIASYLSAMRRDLALSRKREDAWGSLTANRLGNRVTRSDACTALWPRSCG